MPTEQESRSSQLRQPATVVLEVIIDGQRRAYGCEDAESALALKMALIRGCVGFEADILKWDTASQGFRFGG